MTKTDLIAHLAAKKRLPYSQAEMIVEQIFRSMSEAFMRDEGVEIRGFGSFAIRHYKAYAGRNPRTGEAVGVRPKRTPFFKVGKELRQRVDASRAGQKSAGPPVIMPA